MTGVTSKYEHAKRIQRELIRAGVTLYGLIKSESRYLPRIIHEDEHIEAVVYGQHHSSSAMIVATDRRIIYLDKKPMALFMDEVTYDVVSGIEFEVHTLFGSVTLHTAVTNYEIKYANIHCAEKFAAYIEEQRINRENLIAAGGQIMERPEPSAEPAPKPPDDEPSKDLSGYFLIPHDEDEESVRA